jgi:hypothetical protein
VCHQTISLPNTTHATFNPGQKGGEGHRLRRWRKIWEASRHRRRDRVTARRTVGTDWAATAFSNFAQLYQLNLSSAGVADLRLDSTDFNAYLVLLDAKGNLVAQDDDSGGGTNAHIVQQLDLGTYFVVAKPFAYYYATGGYTLTFQPPPAR